jgi:predicted dehydrogenase
MDAKRENLGIVVVGAGFLGAQRAAAAKIARGTSLVAVVDQDLPHAQAIANRHSVRAFNDIDEAFSHKGVNAVIVATPHASHVDIIELALARGKHVLCEKPLAIEADDAWRLAHHADDARLRLATGFNHRFYPPVRDALAFESHWALGRIESVRIQIGHAASQEFLHSWHCDRKTSGGGTLIDNGPHACDLIRRFLGEVSSAQGAVRNDSHGHFDCEREAFGIFRTHENAFGELHSSWNLRHGYLTIEVRGASGWLRVETAPWRLTGQLSNGHKINKHYILERLRDRLFARRYGCERSLVLELESFAMPQWFPRAGATGWDGCRAVEMIQALYESDRTGQVVTLANHLDAPIANEPHRRSDRVA